MACWGQAPRKGGSNRPAFCGGVIVPAPTAHRLESGIEVNMLRNVCFCKVSDEQSLLSKVILTQPRPWCSEPICGDQTHQSQTHSLRLKKHSIIT